MNAVQIDAEVARRLSECKSPEELKEIQKWAQKAKKTPDVELFASSFKTVYYTFTTKRRSQGSGKVIGENVHKVHYTSFTFYGVEVKMPEPWYEFQEADFDGKRLWIDARIKWGGTIYSPRKPVKEFGGIDLEKAFFDLLEKEKYFVFERDFIGKKTYHLCNSDSTARKIYRGQRLNIHDTANCAVVKIGKAELGYFTSKLPMKTYGDIFPKDDKPFWL